jgi:hypothetical protein
METNQIIAELDIEIARLREVRALLSGSADGIKSKAPTKRRTLSAEARKRIAEAQKKRWAKAKKAAKS